MAVSEASQTVMQTKLATNPASGLTFGVEIETHIPINSANIDVQSYYNRGNCTLDASRVPVCNNALGAETGRWEAKSDTSIIVPNHNRKGCEFVSPILKGKSGLRNTVNMVKIIKAKTDTQVNIDGTDYQGCGARVNSSCGIHVHIGFPSNDLRAVQRLVHLVAGYESGLYASTGSKRRETGQWSRPIKTGFQSVDFQKPSYRSLHDDHHQLQARYFGLNLSNLLTGNRPAVEFRLFSGSLNPNKVAAFVSLCLGLVQLALAMPRPAKWNGKPAGSKFSKNGGQGLRELNRLMNRLGWTSTGGAKFYDALGIMEGEGLPSRHTIKKILREMARKYDTQ